MSEIIESGRWLNADAITDEVIEHYQSSLQSGCPKFVVIDDLFDAVLLNEVLHTLLIDQNWIKQRHSYSQLYVDDSTWSEIVENERFVQRDSWQPSQSSFLGRHDCASTFLRLLRSDEFLALLTKIFSVALTDENVAQPSLNTNYFRLAQNDFVGEHVDQSPGREVCLLLYLNRNWHPRNKGELCFSGDGNRPIKIAPRFNRSVLFDPSSSGSEHWVVSGKSESQSSEYRYNVTSWYWRK